MNREKSKATAKAIKRRLGTQTVVETLMDINKPEILETDY